MAKFSTLAVDPGHNSEHIANEAIPRLIEKLSQEQ